MKSHIKHTANRSVHERKRIKRAIPTKLKGLFIKVTEDLTKQERQGDQQFKGFKFQLFSHNRYVFSSLYQLKSTFFQPEDEFTYKIPAFKQTPKQQ